MANLTFDFTPAMSTDSPDRLSYALRNATDYGTVQVLVSAGDTDRTGPIFRALEKHGYECHTKGDAAGGLSITGRNLKGH